MAWQELVPGRAGKEAITISTGRGGRVFVGISAIVAKRNKLVAESRCRVLVDLEASPRVLRIVADPYGAFRVAGLKGDAVRLALAALPGLGHIRVEKTSCLFDEDDVQGKPALDIELPKALQVPEKPAAQKALAAVAANGRVVR